MRNTKEQITQEEIIKEYFINNPNRDIEHPEVVDYVVIEYRKRTNKIFRDPDRGVRKLYSSGFLIKVRKGVYRYDPELATKIKQEDFTEEQKKTIKERDGYKCVICGKGEKDGVDLHVDHIKSKYDGGKAVIENGQTLCSQHNFLKKNLKQTETGKKMFIRLYELAKSENNKELIKFCKDILEVYEKNNINGHIEWKK